MLASLPILILCQSAGEVLHAATGLPVPGPVIGIALLLLGLCMRSRLRPDSAPPSLPAADALLSYLPLFFVPPGVWTVMHIGALGRIWPAVVAALLGSSVITIVVTGRLAQVLLARRDHRAEAPKLADAHPLIEGATT